jgi:colanic acid/amylovoran biosynthesis glycosyltransferase
MRIAYLTSRYPKLSHTFVLREVEALRREGVEVHTFSVRRAEPGDLRTEADRRAFESTYALLPARIGHLALAHARALGGGPGRYVATLRRALALSPRGVRGTVWQLFYFLEAVLLWDRCRRRGIRHLHAHFANVGSDVALLAAHLGGPAWSWSFTMHGPTGFENVSQYRLAAKVAAARFVVCISDFARSQLMSLVDAAQWGKLRVIHCGLDPAVFSAPAANGRALDRLEILTVGRLVPVKGQRVLLAAMAELVRRGRRAHATLVGGGPEADQLAAAIERLGLREHVTLAGPVGQDEIRSYYAGADVFCLPSFAEGLPVVLMEALAMGVPVVTTYVAGIPELVTPGVSGLLVPAGRADLLADALERLADDPEARRAMGEAGRAKVAAEFDVQRSAHQLRELLEEHVGAS